MSTATTLPADLDASVRDLARAAVADELGPDETPGDYLGTEREDDVAVSVRFASTLPGYRGWVWTVTVALVDPARPTVSEVVLLPGPDALLPPEWIPWAERIRPGDLGPGDLMPPPDDDPRLVPAYVQSDDPAVEAVAKELGIGRVRVLSREGRVDLAERLHDGDFGPSSPMAVAAPAHCFSCAFYLPLAGSLGVLAGVCSNDISPADSRLVDIGYGCGAHSELSIQAAPLATMIPHALDELRWDVHARAMVDLDDDAEVEAAVEALDELAGLDVADLAALDGIDLADHDLGAADAATDELLALDSVDLTPADSDEAAPSE